MCGRIVKSGGSTVPNYEINDYLGSVRVVTGPTGSVLARHDYYATGARMYDPSIARWTVQDPLAENLLKLPSGFHGNHQAYSNWIQSEIDNLYKTKSTLDAIDIKVLLDKAKSLIWDAQEAVNKGLTKNLNSFVKENFL